MLGSNYFLGLDVIKFYKSEIEKHPNQEEGLRKEKNSYLIGKWVSNLASLGGIALIGFTRDPAYGVTGKIITSLSEFLRWGVNKNFYFKREEYQSEESIEKNKDITDKFTEEEYKELEKNMRSLIE